MVIVKKKDGCWRFCINSRKLNAMTHCDAYPLPQMKESLMVLKQAAWYSTLDLASSSCLILSGLAEQTHTGTSPPHRPIPMIRPNKGGCGEGPANIA
ncbi:hypothetical protein AAFF_G00135420 [Aldrovandia affinis]|uniref:Reverse transcriptase n=1 Tax=Aldrovandia affinis TaxID=143900 RepID=A0AAD7RSM5_9TELE|nr:hypothetical protein AAFF_G00135420 [Aldrovandia affinis]